MYGLFSRDVVLRFLRHAIGTLCMKALSDEDVVGRDCKGKISFHVFLGRRY